ncbi:MAG: heme exporter protein CcmD [Qingshengfaniella sp.]
MMPDLGKYALVVLASYGVSLTLIVALVWASWRRGVRLRRDLSRVEARRNGGPR